jgi:hypothetical protein
MAFPFTDQHLSSSMHCSVTARDMCEEMLNIHHNECHQLTFPLFNTCAHLAILQ